MTKLRTIRFILLLIISIHFHHINIVHSQGSGQVGEKNTTLTPTKSPTAEPTAEPTTEFPKSLLYI